MVVCNTARQYWIPSSILRGHVYGTTVYRKRNKKGTLTNVEELQLVEYVVCMQDLGFPLSMGQLQEKVLIIIQATGISF